MTCAFVGLGNLGSRLAGRLLDAGYKLRLHDHDPGTRHALCYDNATWAKSPAAAASDVDTLITCLPSPQASRAVLLGAQGALAALPHGATWIEMSTLAPDVIREFAEHANAQGVQVLECPVTGGLQRAASGDMTMFVGGTTDLLARHRRLLETMCARVLHLGAVGTASFTKVLSNALCMIDLIAASEALTLARKGGIDLGQFYRAVCASSGTSREFEDWVPVILNGSFDTGFSLDLALKDLNFVSDLGQAHDVPLALTDIVRQQLCAARERFGGAAWTANAVRLAEESAGVELRADGYEPVIDRQDSASDSSK